MIDSTTNTFESQTDSEITLNSAMDTSVASEFSASTATETIVDEAAKLPNGLSRLAWLMS
jgi:hypothetical protein